MLCFGLRNSVVLLKTKCSVHSANRQQISARRALRRSTRIAFTTPSARISTSTHVLLVLPVAMPHLAVLAVSAQTSAAIATLCARLLKRAMEHRWPGCATKNRSLTPPTCAKCTMTGAKKAMATAVNQTLHCQPSAHQRPTATAQLKTAAIARRALLNVRAAAVASRLAADQSRSSSAKWRTMRKSTSRRRHFQFSRSTAGRSQKQCTRLTAKKSIAKPTMRCITENCHFAHGFTFRIHANSSGSGTVSRRQSRRQVRASRSRRRARRAALRQCHTTAATSNQSTRAAATSALAASVFLCKSFNFYHCSSRTKKKPFF